MRRWTVLLPVLAAGCTSYQVPVSGTVTLDGQPLEGAIVHFQPITPDPALALREASGRTDAEGRFILKAIGTSGGAAIGKNRVRITKLTDPLPGEPQDGLVDRIPETYRAADALTFEVPPSGTTQANFDLVSPPSNPKKKRKI